VNLIRAIIFIVFIYLCYRALRDVIIKPLLKQYRQNYQPAGGSRVHAIGEMVQDPVCKVYIQKSTALNKTVAGQVYYFCSRECMKNFTEKS